MNSTGKALLVLLGGLGMSASLFASIPEKYQTILDRNPFGLNPPAPPSTNTVSETPPAKVNVTGFMKANGEKRAFFVIPAKDPKDTQYLNLSEGQREGGLEVVKISEDDGEVRVKNSGVDQVLSLKDNNMSPMPKIIPGAPGAAPAQPNPAFTASGVPGVPAAPVSPVYNPSASAGVVANFNNNRPQGIPNQNQPAMTQPGGYTAPAPAYNGGGQIQQTGAMTPPALPQVPVRQIPIRPMRPSPVGTPQSSVPQQYQNPVVYNPQPATQPNQAVDPVKQILTMHADAAIAQRQGRAYPPPPPIPQ